MEKYKIAIIDDELDRVRAFKRDTSGVFDVMRIDIKETIKEIIDEIIENQIRAIIVDFDLQTHLYSGIDIINEIDRHMSHFPSFVLTAFEVLAENNIVDVNKIYRKQDGPETLIRRIGKQIEIYDKMIEEAKVELLSLHEKRDSLTFIQEKKLIELDNLIENSIFKKTSLPIDIKEKFTFDSKIMELLESTEELLREVKQKNEEK